MDRSRSAGPSVVVPVADIRGVCKKIAPYIVHQWRDVCEELGVPEKDLDHLEAGVHKAGTKMSDVAFHGLILWVEKTGRAANRDKLLRVAQTLGLRRAEDELRRISQKNTVNALARPVTAVAQISQQVEIKLSKQQKQKALADRLSRPKSLESNSLNIFEDHSMSILPSLGRICSMCCLKNLFTHGRSDDGRKVITKAHLVTTCCYRNLGGVAGMLSVSKTGNHGFE